jgi:hypothetical protein
MSAPTTRFCGVATSGHRAVRATSGPAARFLAPAPPERLAVLRILVGTYGVLWSLVRLPEHLRHIDQPLTRWQPIGVLSAVANPLPDWLVVTLAVATPLLGLVYVAGWRFRTSGPAFAVSLLVLATVDSSWGQIFHTENLMVLHVGIVALAPAADALAINHRTLAGQTVRHGASDASLAGSTKEHVRYGWPVRLAAVVVVIVYVVAGLAKLRVAGLGWADGDVLRNLVAYDNLRKELLGDAYSPLGTRVVGVAWVFPPLALTTLAVELGAWVALFGGRWRTAWVIAAWSFHVGVFALMAILFPYQLSGIAFAPLFRLERVARVWRRHPLSPNG